MDDITLIGSPAVQRYIRTQDKAIDRWHTRLLLTTDPKDRAILTTRIKLVEDILLSPYNTYLREVEGG